MTLNTHSLSPLILGHHTVFAQYILLADRICIKFLLESCRSRNVIEFRHKHYHLIWSYEKSVRPSGSFLLLLPIIIRSSYFFDLIIIHETQKSICLVKKSIDFLEDDSWRSRDDDT